MFTVIVSFVIAKWVFGTYKVSLIYNMVVDELIVKDHLTSVSLSIITVIDSFVGIW